MLFWSGIWYGKLFFLKISSSPKMSLDICRPIVLRAAISYHYRAGFIYILYIQSEHENASAGVGYVYN